MNPPMLEIAYYMATETRIIIGGWKSYDAYNRFSRYSSNNWVIGPERGKLDIIWRLLSNGKWVNIKDQR
jgi:hypothetical protein